MLFLLYQVVGMVRILMMSRSEEAYITLFSYIKQLAPGLDPQRIHCDFERATINALRRAFPRSDIVGCLWHFGVVSIIRLSFTVFFAVHTVFHVILLSVHWKAG